MSVGRGESFLKSCAKGILTRREAHLFLNCRHGLDIEQALRWSICCGAGAHDGMALRVARSKTATLPFDEFWRSALRFFAAHPLESIQECSDVCDYLLWRKREEPAFEIFGHGFTAESIRARMHDWHRDLARSKAIGDARWDGAAIADWEEEFSDANGDKSFWSATPILDAKTLAGEGNAMRHCVLSYKHSCTGGACSIWSIRSGYSPGREFHERKLTVEVRSDGTIVQARGLANRAPRPAESRALRQWARACGLSFAASY